MEISNHGNKTCLLHLSSGFYLSLSTNICCFFIIQWCMFQYFIFIHLFIHIFTYTNLNLISYIERGVIFPMKKNYYLNFLVVHRILLCSLIRNKHQRDAFLLTEVFWNFVLYIDDRMGKNIQRRIFVENSVVFTIFW